MSRGYQFRLGEQRSVVGKAAIKIRSSQSDKERKRAFVNARGCHCGWGVCDRQRSVLYNCVCVEVRKRK